MPNPIVDVSSWIGSACYPRSTFYPLSDGPSIQNHRITKSYFRTCSTRQSRSQAPLYLYALRTITDRAEGTFEHLRYLLGGDRPSQTAHHTLSPNRIHGIGLESKGIKDGIPRLTPRVLAHPLRSLPSILYIIHSNSIRSYSKGSQGLSV